MAEKIKFTIKKERFGDFLSKLEDLTKIDDTIKLKIDNDNILMYSMLGGGIMLAFKNYLVDTSDFLEHKDKLEFSYDIVIANGKKFVKNLDFLKTEDKITMALTCKESQDDDSVMISRSIQVVGGKLKVNWMAAESYEMRDINKDVLMDRLDINKRNWAFALNKKEFEDVKKLSNINSERIISIDVNNGKVVLSEQSAWELEVGEIEDRKASLIFNKRFFKCIDGNREEVEFSMFDTFMLVKDQDSNLMLSYEQDFDDDDV